MIIKKNIKKFKNGLIIFILGLSINLQAIDDDLLESLHGPVPDRDTGVGVRELASLGAAKEEDNSSESGSGAEQASVGSHSTNTRIALTLVDTMGLAHRHLCGHVDVDERAESERVVATGIRALDLASVVGRASEHVATSAPDLTRSAPTVPVSSPFFDAELALAELSLGPRQALNPSLDAVGVGAGEMDSSVELARFDWVTREARLGSLDRHTVDGSGGMGSLVHWQARLTPHGTHTSYRGEVSLTGFSDASRDRGTVSEAARIANLLADTGASGHAITRSRSGVKATVVKFDHVGSADGSGAGGRS